VILYPAMVQGEGAAADIARAIATASARGEVDVLIVARGGGSIEDLWAFNEEVVARAIIESSLPIVSGVGAQWPQLLGYNRVMPKPGAAIVATVGDDPLIVAGAFGKGRSVAFTSDCGPHWAPPPFVERVCTPLCDEFAGNDQGGICSAL